MCEVKRSFKVVLPCQHLDLKMWTNYLGDLNIDVTAVKVEIPAL